MEFVQTRANRFEGHDGPYGADLFWVGSLWEWRLYRFATNSVEAHGEAAYLDEAKLQIHGALARIQGQAIRLTCQTLTVEGWSVSIFERFGAWQFMVYEIGSGTVVGQGEAPDREAVKARALQALGERVTLPADLPEWQRLD